GNIHASITKLEEAQKRPAAAVAKAGAKEPAVAGPGEYVVKGGDTGAKIARAEGVALGDLVAVNPGVDWTKLKPGQKVKLPKK
ncbi:MAG TPA: LysM domain-containing protein, partial [Opitutus sp.]|nr:LysM domain-containing protein [Opitutus sp.]